MVEVCFCTHWHGWAKTKPCKTGRGQMQARKIYPLSAAANPLRSNPSLGAFIHAFVKKMDDSSKAVAWAAEGVLVRLLLPQPKDGECCAARDAETRGA